ncbi:uncharacterized protein N0V89_001110 [Didymosphaeria variabile]|uniref:Uncharacterized protein n=1 Tax=Didymosphaeria variabile TaxID=1932322 RepID=A0A9W9CGG2_9PLEO|nr:uncharacterized protein N0V89_001110 [Didymosphaeria variabile]KAJ4360545.1 hypothetical protein N0V89_001110 [Didymosphaeria variabile]
MAVPDTVPAPKSAHVADPALVPFLQPQFDPANYLNATLPALSLSSVSSRPLKQGHSLSLADLSSHTQDLLSQLNAHTTRLSAILTQLTDDILRSGARLAYEVEVLRGETTGLTETLTDGLKEDVNKFVPGGINAKKERDEDTGATDPASEGDQQLGAPATAPDTTTPDYITQLRVLTLVRNRLETVIKVFGEAMHWTLPPSEVSLASSLISVSAPDPGTDASTREQKGKEFAAALRTEISDLVMGDPESGPETAQTRIQALKDLAAVWKGTAEEKARAKFVEGLVKIVEDRKKDLDREKEKRQRGVKSGSVPKLQAQPPAPQRSGGGFLDNLQRIRENYI